MNKKTVAVVLSLWFVVLMIACGRDLLQPPAPDVESETVAARPASGGEPMRVIHPYKLKLEPANAYECTTVEYTGSAEGHEYARGQLTIEGENRPAPLETQPGATARAGLGRYHYIRWEAETGRMVYEVDCVVPLRADVKAFVMAELRLLGPGGGPGLLQRDTALAGHDTSQDWESGYVECEYDPYSEELDCYGMICEPTGGQTGAELRGIDQLASMSSMPSSWECPNGCILEVGPEGDYGTYECPWEEQEQCYPWWGDDCCWDDVDELWIWDFYLECPALPPPSGGGGFPTAASNLDCEGGTRGAAVFCTVSGYMNNIVQINWTFEDDQSNLQPVSLNNGPTAWTGTGVISGQVTAFIDVEAGNDTTLTDDLEITDRAWSWQSDWFLDSGAALSAGYMINQWPFNVGQPIQLGMWCRDTLCSGITFLRPDYGQGESGGYTKASVSSGPNKGYHYVDAATFNSHTASRVHPYLHQGDTHTFTLSACSGQNWWSVNTVCHSSPPAPPNMADTLTYLFIGVKNHEEYGSTGSNGHESVARSYAQNNDPDAAVEGLVAESAAGLDTAVVQVVNMLRATIESGIAGSGHPTGNYRDKIQVYLISGSNWVLSTLSPGG